MKQINGLLIEELLKQHYIKFEKFVEMREQIWDEVASKLSVELEENFIL